MTPPPKIRLDIVYVTYKPEISLFQASIEALASQVREEKITASLFVWDNSLSDTWHAKVHQTASSQSDAFVLVDIVASEENLGFGQGNNRAFARGDAEFILILNQDAIPEPGALSTLLSAAREDDENTAAWEMRQIPYEHPKLYHPATGETPWVSGAACLLRRSAIQQVDGFDPSIFMYAEDVDLSWRLRAKGWKLKYVPQAAVFHDTYSRPHEEKPLQAVEGTLTNLLLRARFGTLRDLTIGLMGVVREVLRPASFPGRRRAFAMIPFRMLGKFFLFRRSGQEYRKAFKPEFTGWNYCIHRDGAFFRFSRTGEKKDFPLVSILIRTHKRKELLREALISCANQTYPNLEVIVIEDGEPTAENMIANYFGQLSIRYHATQEPIGRSRAGNLALSMAHGEWIGFLDDDDLLFADHVEVLLQTALENQCKASYGNAWEVATEFKSLDPLEYVETMHVTRYRQPFSRIQLWHSNYLPIQSVLFHRSLYEKHGGFEEDMEQLEDWNLWTRYSLEDDFCWVDKTTSLYRVPSCPTRSKDRQSKLDDAYADAKRRQLAMHITTSPAQVIEMAEQFCELNYMVSIDKTSLRDHVKRLGLLNIARKLRNKLHLRR